MKNNITSSIVSIINTVMFVQNVVGVGSLLSAQNLLLEISRTTKDLLLHG